jgi:hypothetical protein
MKPFLFVLSFLYFSNLAIANPYCQENQVAEGLGLGISFQWNVPSEKPVFTNPAPSYGLLLSYRKSYWEGLVGVTYGGTSDITIWLTEADVKIHIEFPWFTPHLIAGAYYLNYLAAGISSGTGGATAGFGLGFPFSRQFQVALSLREYFHEKNMMAFRGELQFAL